HNTALCFTSNSFTVSNPKTTFKDWIKQKRRHVSTAKHYKFLHKTLLALFYISQILFWVLAIVLLSFLFNWQIVASCIAARFLVFYIFLGKTTNKLKEPELIYLAPLLELFLIGVQLVIFIANLISKPKHWK
ncbi:MAG: glycosyl transferase family 2, partial [Oceanihabitans sp.]